MTFPITSLTGKKSHDAGQPSIFSGGLFSGPSLITQLEKNSPHCRIMASLLKEHLKQLVQGIGFNKALIQQIPDTALVSQKAVVNHIFQEIFEHLGQEAWANLNYKALFKLQGEDGLDIILTGIKQGKKEFFVHILQQIKQNAWMSAEDPRVKSMFYMVSAYGQEEMMVHLLDSYPHLALLQDKDMRSMLAKDTLENQQVRTVQEDLKSIEALKECGQKEEALKIAKQMLRVRRQTLGEKDDDTAWSYHKVIELLKELGQKEEVLETAKIMLRTRKAALGEKDAWTSFSYQEVIKALKKLGRDEEALEVGRQMLRTRQEVLEEKDEWIASSYDNVISLLRGLDQGEEALEVARQMLKNQQKAFGQDHINTVVSYQHVIALLRDLEQGDEALEMEQQMLRIGQEAAKKMGFEE